MRDLDVVEATGSAAYLLVSAPDTIMPLCGKLQVGFIIDALAGA
jgi:hypothetical protein